MSDVPKRTARVMVHLSCHEVVVPGGTRTTSWYVDDGKAWLPAHEHPSAQKARVEAGPGTVWEETVSLSVPPTTRLKQLIFEPAPAKASTAFDFLRRDVRGVARRTRERLYAVGSHGQLLPLRAGAKHSRNIVAQSEPKKRH